MCNAETGVSTVSMSSKYTKSFIKHEDKEYIVNLNIEYGEGCMRPSQFVELAREKVEEVAEKTGEVIGKGLVEGWDRVTHLGVGLRKELLRLYKKPDGHKASEKKRGFRRIRDESVKAKTGKVWDEWFKTLDVWGGEEKGHTQTAKHLREQYGLSSWWAQAITIRYEWERGLRK